MHQENGNKTTTPVTPRRAYTAQNKTTRVSTKSRELVLLDLLRDWNNVFQLITILVWMVVVVVVVVRGWVEQPGQNPKTLTWWVKSSHRQEEISTFATTRGAGSQNEAKSVKHAQGSSSSRTWDHDGSKQVPPVAYFRSCFRQEL